MIVPPRIDLDLTLAAPDPNATPLAVWTDPFAAGQDGTSSADADADDHADDADDAADEGAGLPHLGAADLDDLDLPYWSEPA